MGGFAKVEVVEGSSGPIAVRDHVREGSSSMGPTPKVVRHRDEGVRIPPFAEVETPEDLLGFRAALGGMLRGKQ